MIASRRALTSINLGIVWQSSFSIQSSRILPTSANTVLIYTCQRRPLCPVLSSKWESTKSDRYQGEASGPWRAPNKQLNWTSASNGLKTQTTPSRIHLSI